MSEITRLVATGADPGTFEPLPGAAPPPPMTTRTDPDSLPWAKAVSSLSQRAADLPQQFEHLAATRVDGLRGQVELNVGTLRLQHALMTTSLTVQAAVQLMSSTAQVANRMLNQQGG